MYVQYLLNEEWDFSEINLSNNLANFWLWVDIKHACVYLVDSLVKVIKHLIYPHDHFGVLIHKYHLIYIL